MERTSDENMDVLISSIREQTNKLKVVLIQTNLRGRMNNINTPQLSPRVAEFRKQGATSPQQTLRIEFSKSKALIQNLVVQNKSLHEDLQDCKKALQMIVNRFKETKRELELEQLRNSRISLLEKEIQSERLKQKALMSTQVQIKDKFSVLIQTLRNAIFGKTEDELEDLALLEEQNIQNNQLRELLALSTISDPKMQDVQKEIAKKDEVFNVEEHKEILKHYKDRRAEQKRSKSFAVSSRKTYLLSNPNERNATNGIWDTFFNRLARK